MQAVLAEAQFRLAGAALLRGVIPAEIVESAFKRAVETFAQRDAGDAAAPRDDDDAKSRLRRYVRLDEVGSAADFLPVPVIALAGSYLGRDPIVAEQRYIREIRPSRGETHLPFHQDERILGRRAVNVWCSLTPSGGDFPGIEIVLFSHRDLFPTTSRIEQPQTATQAAIEPAIIGQRFPHIFRWRPKTQAGDVIVFAGRTIHRTSATPTMRDARLSAELRLV